jgi:hypothetical protein
VKRALILIGALGLLVGLAFLVARPAVPDAATNPYVGVRGASRSRAAGVAISYQRGGVDHPVEPATALRAGDRLRFVVKGERPRHVELRLRDGDAPPLVYPSEGTTVLVAPKQALPIEPTVGPGRGRVVVTALFSDQPRAVGSPPDPETEAITVAIAKE